MQPTRCLVAYWQDSVDERGYQLNHRARICKAVAAVAKQDVPITFLECTRKGAVGIAHMQFLDQTVEADRISVVLRRLNASGWHLDETTGISTARYGSDAAYVWQEPETIHA